MNNISILFIFVFLVLHLLVFPGLVHHRFVQFFVLRVNLLSELAQQRVVVVLRVRRFKFGVGLLFLFETLVVVIIVWLFILIVFY